MDLTQYPNEVVLTANALIYAEASQIVSDKCTQEEAMENPKVIANVLSLCLKRIKEIDKMLEFKKDYDQRKFYVDIFWYVAEIHKMTKNQ